MNVLMWSMALCIAFLCSAMESIVNTPFEKIITQADLDRFTPDQLAALQILLQKDAGHAVARGAEDLSEELSSDRTRSWDSDEKIIRGGGSASGESGSGTDVSDDGRVRLPEGKEANSQAIQKLKSLFGPKKKGLQEKACGASDLLAKREIVHRPKMKKVLRTEQIEKIERRLLVLKRQKNLLDDREWDILLANVKKLGIFDLIVAWAREHSAFLSLTQMRSLFYALLQEEDLYTAGIELKKEDVFRIDNDESSQELSDREACSSQEDETDTDRPRNGVVRKTPHWRFEKKWNIVKAYFLLMLDVLVVYSQRVQEETTALFSYEADEDLAEILRLAMATYAADVEITLCQTLRAAVHARGGEAETELIACLSHIIVEALDENRPEALRLEPAAVDCLQAIIEARGGDLSNEELLGAFVSVCGAKLETELFEDLLVEVRLLDLDQDHAHYRLNRERSCYTMLEDWALAQYENLEKADKHVQRLTSYSFKQIMAEKDAAEERQKKVNDNKPGKVKKADIKSERRQNRGKVNKLALDTLAATGMDVDVMFRAPTVSAAKVRKTETAKAKERFKAKKDVSAIRQKRLNGLQKKVQDDREEKDNLSEFSKRKKEVSESSYGQSSQVVASGLPLWLVKNRAVRDHALRLSLTPQDDSDELSAGELPPLPSPQDEYEVNSDERNNSSRSVHTQSDAGSSSVLSVVEPIMKKTVRDKPPRKALPQPPSSLAKRNPRSHVRNSSLDKDSYHEAFDPSVGDSNVDISLDSSGVMSQTASQIEAHGRSADRNDHRRRGVTLMKGALTVAITRPQRNESLSSMLVPDVRGSGKQLEKFQEDTSGDSAEHLPEDALE